jgi:hypothetical protein
LGPGASKSGVDALPRHRKLKLPEHRRHLDHRATVRGGRIDGFLAVELPHTDRVEFGHRGCDGRRTPAKTVHGPCHDAIKLPSLSIAQHLPIFASLSRWRQILADLERIEDKDEMVEDAIRHCRREISRIMAQVVKAMEGQVEASALPTAPGPAIPAPIELRPLDFARRTRRKNPIGAARH